MRMLILLLVNVAVAVLGFAAPVVHASSAEALQCAEGMASYFTQRGYRVRSADSDALAQGEYGDYSVTLNRGVEYIMLACGDSRAYDVDIYLYDENGNLIDRDRLTDNKPIVRVVPRWTGTFTVRIKMYSARALANYTMGVLYAR